MGFGEFILVNEVLELFLGGVEIVGEDVVVVEDFEFERAGGRKVVDGVEFDAEEAGFGRGGRRGRGGGRGELDEESDVAEAQADAVESLHQLKEFEFLFVSMGLEGEGGGLGGYGEENLVFDVRVVGESRGELAEFLEHFEFGS